MTTKKPNSTFEKQALWSKRIQSWHKSGLAQKEWCSQNRIPLSTFNYWRRKLNLNASRSIQDSEPVFAKLPSEEETETASCRQTPISFFIGSIRIEIAAGCPAGLLSSLLGSLSPHA